MRHPVHTLLTHHAYCRATPSDGELAGPKLDASVRGADRTAAAEAHQMHSVGE